MAKRRGDSVVESGPWEGSRPAAGPSDALATRPQEVEPQPQVEAEAVAVEHEELAPAETDVDAVADGPEEEFTFSCPGCPMVWSSEIYSNKDHAEAACKGHIYRHAHARPGEDAPGSRFRRHA